MEIAGEPSLDSNGLGTGGIFAFEVYALVLLVQRLPVEPLDQLEEAAGDCSKSMLLTCSCHLSRCVF